MVSDPRVNKSQGLKPGDKIVYLSPGSTPQRAGIEKRIAILQSWGLEVEVASHAFDKIGYLAGRDEDRISDINAAIADPDIRAIFATRGGKGCYRIADRLDYEAWQKDPKLLVGFSDVTALHLCQYLHCQAAGIHGALFARENDVIAHETSQSLRTCLTRPDEITVKTRLTEPTAAVTTEGRASGILIGGNLQLIATLAGWGLPDLKGKIVLLEDVDQHPGQIDRMLIQLIKSGLFDQIAGVALGQFADCRMDGPMNAVSVLKDHLQGLSVPVLGGLPIGHGQAPVAIPHGTMANLDIADGMLRLEPAIF